MKVEFDAFLKLLKRNKGMFGASAADIVYNEGKLSLLKSKLGVD